MKLNSKKMIILLVVLLIILSPLTSLAVTLEASSTNNPYTNNVSTMFDSIRDMTTGTLGLTNKNAADDNLDCHMCKNSEYGAALILTISAFGRGATNSTGSKSATDTSSGNASGIYQLAGNWEYTAAYYSGASTPANLQSLYSAPDKYKDVYSATNITNYLSGNSKIAGDALFPIGFLGSSNAYWPNATSPVFLRGGASNGFFSYSYNIGTDSDASRAVVVCGAGL